MGMLQSTMSLLSGGSGGTSLIPRYKQLHRVRMKLNNELASRLSTDVLHEGGQRLGMLSRGIFVFNTEDETSVLMDYCIYDVRRKGRNAVEQYLCESPPDADSDELVCLRAMQHAKYALLAVEEVVRGVGCRVHDLFSDERRLLVDVGLSKTGMANLLIATRIVDFGQYIATTGASLPIGVLSEDEMSLWRERLEEGIADDDFDPAPLIRKCLKSGMSESVRYAEPGMTAESFLGSSAEIEPCPPRRRTPKTAEKRKPVEKRRCRCGSGKMFKNCCGKQ